MRRPSLPKLPAMRRPPLPKLRRRPKKPLTPQQAAAAPAPILTLKLPRKLPGKLPRKLPPLKLILPAAAAIVVVVLLVVLIGTCGSDEKQNVRDTLDRFGQATSEKDYQTLCDDLFATSLVEKLRTADQPCEVALRIGLSEVQSPTIEVLSVEVDGDKATALVRAEAVGQQPARETILLVREDGDWRISSRPKEQQPAAAP